MNLVSSVVNFVLLWQMVASQFDGGFWWTNQQLLDKASQSRNSKNINFKSEVSEERSHNRSEKFLYNSDSAKSDDDGNVNDCSCVPRCQCRDVMDLPDVTENHLSPLNRNPYRYTVVIRNLIPRLVLGSGFGWIDEEGGEIVWQTMWDGISKVSVFKCEIIFLRFLSEDA